MFLLRRILFLLCAFVFSLPATATTCSILKNNYMAEIVAGTIQVPLHHPALLDMSSRYSLPDDTQSQITLAYFYRPSSSDNPAPPLLVLNGGPGVSSHHMMAKMLTDKRLSNVPLVFMDQRGTGCSTHYPILDKASIAHALHWGSSSIVHDAELLRKSLFPNQKWRLFGHSYGGLIAYRYIELLPQALSDVTIFGYSPTHDPIDWLYRQTRFISEQSHAYLAKYPDDKKVLTHMRSVIETDTCLQMSQYEICGDAILDALGHHLAFYDYWPNIHYLLNELAQAWETPREQQAMLAIAKIAFAGFKLPGGGLVQNAISNYEIVAGYTPKQAFDKVNKRMIRNRIDTSSWLFNPIYYMQNLTTGNREDIFVQNISHSLSLAKITEHVSKHLDIRLNLFAGERDGIVPPALFTDINSQIKSQRHFTMLRDAGHNDFMHSQVLQALKK